MPEERLQKILAQAGLGSRRACEELIKAGRVAVDGKVITELGTQVDPAAAFISVDGRPIGAERPRYIMLHKPAGYLSGPDARAGYPSWLDLVQVPERLYAVGRLDQDSEGLLLLTNDGELANHLMHPRYRHPKTYLVQVEGVPELRKIRRLQHGVMLDDGPTLPARVVQLRKVPPGVRRGGPARPAQRDKADSRAAAPPPPDALHTSWLKVTLWEGRKRQLRRMVGLLGHPALRLIRVGLGPLLLDELPPGRWRDLTPGEVKALREAAFRGEQAGKDAPSAAFSKGAAVLPDAIAIDGPSASGKSTIGGLLAKDLAYLYFDTGVMYRAVAAAALAQGLPIEDEAAVTTLAERVCIEILSPTVADGRDVTVLVDGQDVTWALRKPEVERAVSPVSAYAGVRHAMVLQQRRIGEAGRVVMVGRDIGTVVLPDADLKIYLDASAQERARRRLLERQARGEKATLEEVLRALQRRDQYDSSRAHSPLMAASDAIVIDSTGLTIEQVMARVRALVDRWSGRVAA